MRAGAREFLTPPFTPSALAEALVRASVRRSATRPAKKTNGKLFVFLGAKGGSGATTLACNYAVSLAKESGLSTLLIDLDLPLGDAALNLGINAQYSTVNALQNFSRLDSTFLSMLLTKHSSGLFVLAAPGKFPHVQAPDEAVNKLLAIARQDFEYVVVDAGARLDLGATALFAEASAIYLVTQVSIPELRNSNRLVSEYFSNNGPQLEIVLNRFKAHDSGVDEDHVAKALTRPARWKIPGDYPTVRRMQDTATPITLGNSSISRIIQQMARTACGLSAVPEKKKGFSLLR
jgi:pilus assembly protein CpaE